MTSSRTPARRAYVAAIPQPASARLIDSLCSALADNRYTEMKAAVAYATTSGVRELADSIRQTTLSLKWLTAIDWFRSEPAALGSLDGLRRSTVRIHNGREVVGRPGCVPRSAFHPKAFLFTGPDSALLISGSGNLSANGLRRGIELGTIIAATSRASRANRDAQQALGDVRTWFDTLWRAADGYASLAGEYTTKFALRPAAAAVMDFGDPPEPGAGRFTAEQLAQVSHAETMWIEAGNLTASTSQTPGHQLMMRPYTRVFFGVLASPVPRMTHLGDVLIRFGSATPVFRSIEYAHNSMDRLNLPHSDGIQHARYDGETLVFRKRPGRGTVVFELTVASKSDVARLKRSSQRNGLAFKMSGPGREFGFI